MKKIGIFLLIFYTCVCMFSINKIKATEELPDNGAIITSSQVIQTKTGTGPWDDNDEPGNDSSEDNNIVRSFDQVTWTIENTMALNNTTSDSYTGGRIYIKATLPEDCIGLMHWDTDSMTWTDGTQQILDNGRTFFAYYTMSNKDITVPGKQAINIVLKVDGATNGKTISPEFNLWLNGNTSNNYKQIKSNEIIVSSKPSYNIKLVRNGIKNEVSINQNGKKINGIVYGYSALIQLYNNDSSKELKGTEYPKGDISFDIETQLLKYPRNTGVEENITGSSTPILYNYSLNGNNDSRFYSDRTLSLFSGGDATFSYPGGNRKKYGIANSYELYSYIYKSGNFSCVQDNNVIHVKVNDYDFDGFFPSGYTWSSVDRYPKNVGNFSNFLFQIFVPITDENTEDDATYYLTVNNNNFLATSNSGQKVNSQVIKTDDESRVNFFIEKGGSYWVDCIVYDENCKNRIHSTWGSGDAFAYRNQIINLTLALVQPASNSPTRNSIRGANVLLKFDDKGYEPVELNGKKFRCSADLLDFNILYATKLDGTGWNDIVEQNNAKIENLEYYSSLEEIKKLNKICVGVLLESKSGEFAIPQNYTSNFIDYLYFPMKIKRDADISDTYQFTSDVRLFNNEIDRSIESMAIDNNSYSSIPVYRQAYNDYIKTEYNENGQIDLKTHYPTCKSGNSVLVISAKTTIQNGITQIMQDGSQKINYDLGRNEYIVEYKLSPNLISEYNANDLNNINLKICDKLPKEMEYIAGSSNYGEPDVVTNEDGTKFLIWNIYNCSVNKVVEPIVFKAHINEETLNGTQLETICTIDSYGMDNREIDKYRTSKKSIRVTNLSSHRLYKTIDTPVIEKNGEIHFTLSYKNNTDETIPDFQLLDILPYNGDSRGTEFNGTYTLDRLVVTQEDGNGNKLSNDNLEIYYTYNENGRNATCKDENLGVGWTRTLSENVKRDATAIAVKGEVGAQGKVTVDVYLKTSGNKGLDKYVNNATAQVYKATEEMTTSNVVSQVVERKIEGIAWEDKNSNGLKDEDEKILNDIELTLTDSLGNQVTDINGNKISSVRTDEKGYYKFENLPKGNYYVRVSLPNSDYELTPKEVGSNSEINSKFNVDAKETDEITKLNSIDLPELTVSNVNVGFIKKATSIIVKHQTEDGTDLVEHEIIAGKIGEEYKTEPKDFEEYELKTIPENANGTMEEEVIEVIYVYSLVKGKIIVTKVDNIDNSKVLSGATFKIEKLIQNNEVDNEFAIVEKTTGEDGIVEFTHLTIGKYRITETKAPEGYELKSTPINIEITKNSKEQNIIATDRLKLQLPATGGNGILVFIIASGIIVILALSLRKFNIKNIFIK